LNKKFALEDIPISVRKKFFNELVDKNEDGCWIFNGSLDKAGYGRVFFGYGVIKAHRLSYLLANKTMDHNLCVCHACDVKNCVNPDHLWQGTSAQNTKDKMLKNRHRNQNMGKTHCIRGHEFTPENTKILKGKNGTRRNCKACSTKWSLK
jgi:hypothetical protein